MGRKRLTIDLTQEIELDLIQKRFEKKDDEGLYPFSTSWEWLPKSAGKKEQAVSLSIDSKNESDRFLKCKRYNPNRFFYSLFSVDFPWAVRIFAQALKTICLESLPTRSSSEGLRSAVGEFFGFCKGNNIPLNEASDCNFELFCKWRSYLKTQDKQSREKSRQYRSVCRVVERVLGTKQLPVKFTMPVYSYDSPEHLPPYSDAVMYQLISACISDVQQIMAAAKGFEIFAQDLLECQEDLSMYDWRRLPKLFLETTSFRSATDDDFFPSNGDRKRLTRLGNDISKNSESDYSWFLSSIPLITSTSAVGHALLFKRMTEKEVPTRDSLVPFLLLFLMFSGKNKETVLSWKSKQRVGGGLVPPTECKDPLSSDKCWVRGYKKRGKGRAVAMAEDTYIKISNDGIYPMLQFLLWYVEPLAKSAAESHRDSMWLYVGEGGVGSFSQLSFFKGCRAFLTRHQIWDISTDSSGEFIKQQLIALDTRRFRKVFASRELFKSVAQSGNHKELSDSLAFALQHKKFDTTLGSYMALGASKDITDVGIFSLQIRYVEEARKFRGEKVAGIQVDEVAGLYAACANPNTPDYEGAPDRVLSNCVEYDMCLGCTQSRVFEVHLPRIAKRITQYKKIKTMMPPDIWEAQYGRKLARAEDVLLGWSDRKAVENAVELAENGNIILPEILVSGVGNEY